MSNTPTSKRNTPNQRKLRSNSVNSLTLKDVKDLIDSMRLDILSDLEKKKQASDDLHIQDLYTQIRTLEKSNTQLKEEVNFMKVKVSNMECTQKVLTQNNEILKKEIEKIQSFSTEIERKNNLFIEEVSNTKKSEIFENVKEDAVTTTVDELQRRSAKQYNLIVFGVPELQNGSLQQRIDHDQTFCQLMLNRLDFNESSDPPHRFGKIKPGHSRPLRLTCKTLSHKFQILRASKRLKDVPECRNVFVRPDLTQMQRENDQRLRNELKQRRQGGEDVVIFRGNVIRRDLKQNFPTRF